MTFCAGSGRPHQRQQSGYAAISLLEARADQMLTETQWEDLAQAVKEETGQYVEWRN